ncbi:hypothetical protein GCM10027202_02610 [Microvirgula curvata]
MVAPGSFGRPLVTMRNGSPPVCISTVLIMRFRFMEPRFGSGIGGRAGQSPRWGQDRMLDAEAPGKAWWRHI